MRDSMLEGSKTEKHARYENRFQSLRAMEKKTVIPFTVLGWPDRETSLDIIKTMVDAGASALELGIAFSDPVADGPVIQQAAQTVLRNGFRLDDAFRLIQEVRSYDPQIPIGLLVYYNLIIARGVEPFLRQAASVGVDSVLIPDLPLEHVDEVYPVAQAFGIRLVMMVSPLTTFERLEKIKSYAQGFFYVVSRLGTTGSEARYDEALQTLLTQLAQVSSLPKCVGFGISTPEQASHMMALGADGVVIGSKILELYQANQSQSPLQVLKDYLKSF